MNVPEFVGKWQKVTLKERSASHEHFINLCDLLEHPTPAKADPHGESFCFERGVHKSSGGNGWADVWKRQHFAWEYKGKHKHKDFDEAYAQLNRYRESLENPPLLVVCDIDKYEIHTNFTGTATEIHRFAHKDLVKPEVLSLLRKAFYEPDKLRPSKTPTDVTEEAVAEFCKISDRLRARSVHPKDAAHFLMKIVFCLFAEDVALLPRGLFAKMVARTADIPEEFSRYAKELFSAMATGGKSFLLEPIHYFDGGLFADDQVLDLDQEDLSLLTRVSQLDWSNIEPAIFGTLLERSLDPTKRSQLGAHYTSREDIIAIVEPVLMAPLRREWDKVRAEMAKLRIKMEALPSGKDYREARRSFEKKAQSFLERLRTIKILDPACGSGNFLYVSLKLLKDLEKAVITFAASAETMNLLPLIQPDQLFGIEKNAYARELASVVVWIGYIQWMRDNGFTVSKNPILQPLNRIVETDGILNFHDPRHPNEPDWPTVDVIVGNPPFLGGKFLRRELGREYVDKLFETYEGRVPHEADLVCYWFEKARAMVEAGSVNRVGLLSTQGIRGGANRKVLERIKEVGNIFFAVSDREWKLEGAMVHVSMIGFDNGTERNAILDGKDVESIHANLSSGSDTTTALGLRTNLAISFMGDTKGGAFDVAPSQARKFLTARNPHGKPNADVIRPWVNGMDVLRVPRGMWIIDFGTGMTEAEASLFESPFEHVRKEVRPLRLKNQRESYRKRWWVHVEPRPAMRTALKGLKRFIASPTTSKHRIFVWLPPEVLPDHQLIVFARQDDYAFGVLHSRVHEVWARRTGTQLREAETGFRYTPTTTFETFPFPWPLGQEVTRGNRKLEAIAEAAKGLNQKREEWLGPIHKRSEATARTLTQLYNQRPTWLSVAHSRLDEVVLDAYGWPRDIADADLLRALLKLNTRQGKVQE